MTTQNALAFLSAMKQISPREWAGPCPFCGGADRFRFWTDNERGNGKGGRYLCRYECEGSKTSGDGVQLVRLLKGVGYREACAMLGIDAGAFPSAVRVSRETHNGTTGQSGTKRDTCPDGVTNLNRWQGVAAQFLTSCQRELVPGAVPSAGVIEHLLYKRRICPATAIALGIGYYAENKYVPAETWGIDSRATNSGKIRIPGPGVVISCQRQGKIVGLYVHFDKPERFENGSPCKGRMVKGSAKDTPFIAGEAGKPCFVLESALDAALVWQEGRGRVSAIGMNGGRKPVDAACMDFIRQAPYLILCGDRDANGAGDKAMEAWNSLFSSAVPCFKQYAVGAKDVGEMHSKACYDSSLPTLIDFINIILEQRGGNV